MTTELDRAYLEAALDEFLGDCPPRDLRLRILAAARRAAAANANGSPRSVWRRSLRVRAVATACSLIALAVVVFIAVLARSDASRESKQQGLRFVPLDLGNIWTYRATRGAEVSRVTEVVSGWIRVRGKRVWQVQRQVSGSLQFSYVAIRDGGVLRFVNRRSAAVPGVDRDQPPATVLPLPMGVKNDWVWTESVMRDSVPGTGSAGDPRRDVVRCVARVVAPSTAVAVPAGLFEATLVEVERSQRGRPVTLEHRWYVAGTGVVKRTVRDLSGQAMVTEELESLVLAPLDADPESVDRDLIARDPELQSLGAVETHSVEVGDASLVVRSAFARLVFERRTVLVRRWRNRSVRFDPRQEADWTRLIRDERIDLPQGGLRGQVMMTALGGLACRLIAGERGWTDIGQARMVSVSFQSNGTAEMRVSITAATASGTGRLESYMLFGRSGVEAVMVREFD